MKNLNKKLEYEKLVKIRDDLKEKSMNAKTIEEMDRLHLEYIEACNNCEAFRLNKKK